MALLTGGTSDEALQIATRSLELATSSFERAMSHLLLCFVFHKLGRSLEAELSAAQFIIERQNPNLSL